MVYFNVFGSLLKNVTKQAFVAPQLCHSRSQQNNQILGISESGAYQNLKDNCLFGISFEHFFYDIVTEKRIFAFLNFYVAHLNETVLGRYDFSAHYIT